MVVSFDGGMVSGVLRLLLHLKMKIRISLEFSKTCAPIHFKIRHSVLNELEHSPKRVAFLCMSVVFIERHI